MAKVEYTYPWVEIHFTAALGPLLATLAASTAVAAAEDGGRETVLVTGGLGFIGSHVVEELLARSYAVIVYDDESNGHNHNLGALNVHGDVTVVHDFRQLLSLPVTVDYVVHLAAAISVVRVGGVDIADAALAVAHACPARPPPAPEAPR